MKESSMSILVKYLGCHVAGERLNKIGATNGPSMLGRIRLDIFTMMHRKAGRRLSWTKGGPLYEKTLEPYVLLGAN